MCKKHSIYSGQGRFPKANPIHLDSIRSFAKALGGAKQLLRGLSQTKPIAEVTKGRRVEEPAGRTSSR